QQYFATPASTGITGVYVGTTVTTVGQYTFTFTIPAGTNLHLTMVYISTPAQVTDSITIQITNPCIGPCPTNTIIVTDNLGDQIGLPNNPGSFTGGYTVSNPAVTTSPYLLTVY